MQDAEAVASYVARRITETGACLLLNIKPETWMVWKTRNKNSARFEKVLHRVRETKIDATLKQIDEAGDEWEREYIGKDGEVRSIKVKGDWRAKAWIAERVLAPERFADRRNENAATGQPVVQVNVIAEGLKRVYGVIEAPREVKALPNASDANGS